MLNTMYLCMCHLLQILVTVKYPLKNKDKTCQDKKKKNYTVKIIV